MKHEDICKLYLCQIKAKAVGTVFSNLSDCVAINAADLIGVGTLLREIADEIAAVLAEAEKAPAQLKEKKK